MSTAIVACGVMGVELERLQAEGHDVAVHLLDQGMHETPKKMPERIQAAVDECTAAGADRVVLGYGLCSMGICGVKTRAAELYVPLVHDCIALFLGSDAAYREATAKSPGTFYLTPGWVACGGDPLSYAVNLYAPRIGLQEAYDFIREELSHYTHIAFIDTGAGDAEATRLRAQENASFLGKEFLEIRSDLRFLRKLVQGPYDNEEFLRIPPGEEIVMNPFLGV